MIVFLHFVLASSLLVLGLLTLCAPEQDLGRSDTRKVHPAPESSAHEPLMSLMASALTSERVRGELRERRLVLERAAASTCLRA